MIKMKIQFFVVFLCLFGIAFSEISKCAPRSDKLNESALVCAGPDQNIGCFQNNEPFEFSEILALNWFETFFFVLVCPIAFSSAIFIIVTFYQYPRMRKQPGDIILAITISDAILCAHWFMMGLYNMNNGYSPIWNSGYCQFNSFLSISAGGSDFGYNSFFCLYVFLLVKYPRKETNIKPIIMHSIVISFSLGIAMYVLISGRAGLTLFGTCSLGVHPGLGYGGFLLLFTYALLAGTTMYYFKKNMPIKITQEEAMFKQYLFYTLMVTLVIYLVLAISNFALGLNCSGDRVLGVYVFFGTMGNIMKVFTPICFMYLRLRDPILRARVRKTKQNFKIWLRQKFPSCFGHTYAQVEDSRVRLMSEEDKSGGDTSQVLKRIRANRNLDNVYSMLAGVSACLKTISDSSNSQQSPSVNTLQFTKSEFEDQIMIELNENNLSKDFPDLPATTPRVQGDFVFFAPQVFQGVIESDRIMINPQQSFNLAENLEQIYSEYEKQIADSKTDIEGDGGAGGEFMYFTKDNEFIIQTMSEDEQNFYLLNLEQFIEHYQSNRSTLISKFYGIFRWVNSDTEKNLMIMRNIVMLPKQYCLRRYDLQGSTSNRQVLPLGDKTPQEDRQKKTLKDEDYENLTQTSFFQKMTIENQLLNNKINTILKLDVEFLFSLGVMDYSLFISKIRVQKFLMDNQDQIDGEPFLNQLSLHPFNVCVLPIDLEPGNYIHLGIIDYLQEWNTCKKAEALSQKFIAGNQKVDISACEPELYIKRFKQKVIEQIFPQFNN